MDLFHGLVSFDLENSAEISVFAKMFRSLTGYFCAAKNWKTRVND